MPRRHTLASSSHVPLRHFTYFYGHLLTFEKVEVESALIHYVNVHGEVGTVQAASRPRTGTYTLPTESRIFPLRTPSFGNITLTLPPEMTRNDQKST